MRFLVDAQLPRRFCGWLAEAGHEAVHTLELPHRNQTTDNEILDLAEREQRIVVTKDDDFAVVSDYGAPRRVAAHFNRKYRK